MQPSSWRHRDSPTTLSARYAKSVLLCLGGIVTKSVDPQPTQGEESWLWSPSRIDAFLGILITDCLIIQGSRIVHLKRVYLLKLDLSMKYKLNKQIWVDEAQSKLPSNSPPLYCLHHVCLCLFMITLLYKHTFFEKRKCKCYSLFVRSIF